MYEKISNWLDEVMEQDIPNEVIAFCFNIYEENDSTWSMELIGTEEFDEEDDDWACEEVSDFGTRENQFRWSEEAEWNTVLDEIRNILEEYLENGRYANILKSKAGVGVGFVDGDVEILYKK